MPTARELKEKQQLYWEDVLEDHQLPDYCIGPITTTHIFRWSAAIENWHRIHYDQDFAIYHDELPNVLAQGSWKQSVMPQYLKDICLPDGWAWKVSFQHRAMIVPGDTIACWAKVTNKYEKSGLGFVELETGMRIQSGIETCPGHGTIVLPIRNGIPVPYPFVISEKK